MFWKELLMSDSAPAVVARDLVKVYGSGPNAVTARDGVDVDFAACEFIAIIGPSVFGQSNRLYSLAGLVYSTRWLVLILPRPGMFSWVAPRSRNWMTPA